MFPDKYKHHSRQPQSSFARIANKFVALFKRDSQVAKATNGWVI